MKELLPVFSLPLSPLALFSPSFSDKFMDVAKLQLVEAKYVTQQWPVTAFFTITLQELQSNVQTLLSIYQGVILICR